MEALEADTKTESSAHLEGVTEVRRTAEVPLTTEAKRPISL